MAGDNVGELHGDWMGAIDSENPRAVQKTGEALIGAVEKNLKDMKLTNAVLEQVAAAQKAGSAKKKS